MLLQRLADLVLVRLDGHHRAAAGQRLHQPAAGGDQPGRVGEGEARRPRARRRARRSSARPGRPARTPQRLQQPEQRHLEGEQRRLGQRGLVQQGGQLRARLRRDHLVQRASPAAGRARPGRRPSASANTGNRRASSRPMPARWLPCPVNSTPTGRGGAGRPGDQPARALAGGQRGQPGEQLGPVGAEHHRAVVERPRGRWPAWWPRRRAGAPARRSPPPAAARACARSAEAVRARHRPGHQLRRRPARPPAPRPARPRRACSTITCALVPLIPNEETPARRGRSGCRPRRAARSSSRDRAGRPVDVRRRLVDVQGPGQHAVPHRHAPS